MAKIKYTATSKESHNGTVHTKYSVTENGKSIVPSTMESRLYSNDLIQKRMSEFNEQTIRVEGLTKIITTTQFETGR